MNREEAIAVLRNNSSAVFRGAPILMREGTHFDWEFNSGMFCKQGYENICESDLRKTVNKYHRQLKGVTVDVYDVLKAFNVTRPATQHALKKMLCTGLRGHKDAETDLNEAIASLQRAKELLSDE